MIEANGAVERLDGAALTVAGHDHLAAAVGSGATNESQVMDSCGTAEALVRAIPADAARDPAQGLPQGIATGWHVLPDRYCLLAGLPLGIDLTPLLTGSKPRTAAVARRSTTRPWIALDRPHADAETTTAAREWLAALQGTVARASASLRALEDSAARSRR